MDTVTTGKMVDKKVIRIILTKLKKIMILGNLGNPLELYRTVVEIHLKSKYGVWKGQSS